MHGDTAAARDVADNFVAGNGIATLGAVDEQIAVAFDDQRRLTETQHALDGFDESGLGVHGFGLGGFFRFSEKARENLAGGIFSEANGGVEILSFGKTVVGNKFVDVSFRNFLYAARELAPL